MKVKKAKHFWTTILMTILVINRLLALEPN